MRIALRTTLSLSLLLVLALSAVALGAQAPTKTATQFYMEYRAAFDKATKIDEVLPYMSAENRKQVEATPAAERAEMFQMIKTFSVMTDVKVTKEERAGTGATLTVEGVDGDKKKSTGKVDIIREGGAWKIGKESWSSSS